MYFGVNTKKYGYLLASLFYRLFLEKKVVKTLKKYKVKTINLYTSSKFVKYPGG